MFHVLPRKVVGHDTLIAQSKSPPCSTTADHSQKDCTWNGWYQLVNPWRLWDLSEAEKTIEHSQYIYIYICTRPCHPPLPPPWDGSHILPPYEIFPLPPCGVVGVWQCPPPRGVVLSPSPPVVWWGCGMVCWVCMVCMVGLVWHVWKVWYVWYVW